MKAKLTTQLIAGLKAQAQPYEVRDTGINGMLLRVQPTGRATYYYSYKTRDGRRNRVKLGRHPDLSLPQARTLAEIERASVVMGGDPAAEKKAVDVPDPDTITLRQFIEGPYAEWAQTPGNLKSHGATLARLRSGFVPLLDLPLADLTVRHFDEHRTWRLSNILPDSRKKPSPATCNRDIAHLRAALSKAVDWRLLPLNPLRGIKLTREDKNSMIRALSDEEESRIMAVFESKRAERLAQWAEANKRRRRPLPPCPYFLSAFEPLFVLSLHTGLRMGEARTLLWSDIDLAAPAVVVRGEKAKSFQSRKIPLSTTAAAAMKAWQDQSLSDGDAFPDASEVWITNQWRTLCRRATITGLRWHDLRHTFGSRCARAGVPVTTIKLLMGHSSITTTQRYLHATADDAIAAIALLEGKQPEE